jgi:hypothetical protein
VEQGQRPCGANGIWLVHFDEIKRKMRPGQDDRRVIPTVDGCQHLTRGLPLNREDLGMLIRTGWRWRLWTKVVASGQ